MIAPVHLVEPIDLAAVSRLEIQKRLALSVEYIYAASVEGDVAEFGVNSGVTAAVLARSMKHFDEHNNNCTRQKKLHLFDSFQGLPRSINEVDLQSPHVASGTWGEGTCMTALMGKDRVHEFCSSFFDVKRVAVYEGWFSDTLCQISPDIRFALIHVDCDLYQSTKEVLWHCFSNQMLQNGSVVLFDDWNPNYACPTLGQRRAWAEAVDHFDVNYSDCGEYGWGCRKFIVH